MINWNIAGVWQNWVIVFLMFVIPATVIHLFLVKSEDVKNGD